MTADLRRSVTNHGDALNTLVCTLGKEITKKNGMSTPLHFTLVQRLPPKPLVTSGACGVLWAT